jgi:hypothetical protein
MENYFAIFPRYGRFSSTVWKIQPCFSTLWKTFEQFFHAMEDFLPHRGKLCPIREIRVIGSVAIMAA